MDRQAERFALRPDRVVARVVIGRPRAPLHREDQAAEPVLLRPADLRDRVLDLPEDRHAREAHAPLGRHRHELRHPAVVRAAARPLQLGHDALGRHREAAAERRRVHLGDAVGEQDLARDAVAVDHREARVGIPRARERALAAAPPLRVDVGDQEALLRGLRHLDLDRERRVERRVVLLLEIVLVALGRQARVAVRRDHEIALARIALTRAPQPAAGSRTGAPTSGTRRGRRRPRRAPAARGAPCCARSACPAARPR